jgi:hypothetical protein
MPPAVAVVLSFVTGILLEFVVHAVTGRREAWDSPVFWTYGMPAALGASFAIGLFAKGRAWLGTLAVAPGQVAAMMVRSGEIGNLWPLALVLSAILSAPFVGASFLGWKARAAQRRFSISRL